MSEPGLRVVSGAQTGVDRAALDVALDAGLLTGGWVPRGRLAEDGRVPDRYPVRELASGRYAVRTRRNVTDSDATLVITRGPPSAGTAWTITCTAEIGRPCRIIDLQQGAWDAAAFLAWLDAHAVKTLNVAGPRESTSPGIYAEARALLGVLFGAVAARQDVNRR